MAFTELFCRASGNNMNGGGIAAGTEPGTAAAYTATNGGWNSGTGVFTPTSGNPSLSVSVGDFAHVYPDGRTVPLVASDMIALVTAVSTTTVTLSTTSISGVAPTTAGTGVSLKVGGAWLGPNGTDAFPFGYISGTLRDAGNDNPRINMKNDAQYNVTAAIVHSINGPARFEGYTATAGDGGRATIDGGTSGTCYTLLSLTLNFGGRHLKNLILAHNGATSPSASLYGLSMPGNGADVLERVTVHDMTASGFSVGNSGGVSLVECEAYNNNTSGQNNCAGFTLGASARAIVRCISHDNQDNGGTTHGFIGGQSFYTDCIADSNGTHGFYAGDLYGAFFFNCDAYNNGGNGCNTLNPGGGYLCVFQNCNFVKNTLFGIAFGSAGSAGVALTGSIKNCGFGAGSTANVSGNFSNVGSIEVAGSITYTNTTPWVDPLNGDFRISSALAKGGLSSGGVGTYFQTTPLTGVITGATNATPIVITSDRKMRTGETVTIASVGGNTAANGTFVVTNVSATTFSLNGTTGNGAYTSGGTYSVPYTGTVAYPDTGASQHLDSAVGGGVIGVIGS